MLDLQFSSKARKSLNNIEGDLWNRIIIKLEELTENPFPIMQKELLEEMRKLLELE